MECLILVFFVAIAIKLFLQLRKPHQNLPPSPLALPLIGHLHLVKKPIHRTFNELSKRYGPIVSLKLGSHLAIIVSSQSLANECFTKNDAVLANRPTFPLAKYLQYNTTVGSVHYGDHWRMLRRINYAHFFSPASLNLFSDVRKDEVRALLRRLSRISSHGFAKVTLEPMFFDLTCNIITRAVAGKRYFGEDVTESKGEVWQFKEVFDEFVRMIETVHPSDIFPILKLVDYDGFGKKLERVCKRIDAILQKLVDEQRIKENGNTTITRLLTLQETDQQEIYTDELIKGLALGFLLGGTHTITKSLEWAMTNLLNHPNVLVKAKQELNSQIADDRLINEEDLPKLHYLRSIIVESMRLCPVTPLLVPHMPSEDCTIGSYFVPRGSMVFVNVWAIQRDPNIWEDPLSFKPERFENENLEEYKKKFFPFGRGRRICPGEELAYREMGLVLGSLIQCFEWERAGESKIDMTENVFIAMSKAKPLVAICKTSSNLQKFL